MVPTHALRLQAMLRSLTEVIIPALDPSQRLAIDQANIVAGNLRILLDQTGRTDEYLRVELHEFRDLGSALLELAPDTPDAYESRSALTEADAVSEWALAEQLLRLKGTVDRLLKMTLASSDPSVAKAASVLVLDQARKQATRERVWFRGAGFELDPTALPPLDAVLSR